MNICTVNVCIFNNNKVLSLVIHAGDEGGDIAEKKVTTRVIAGCVHGAMANISLSYLM